MIEIDGKIYRNLEEQVRKNKDDIESIDTNVTSNTNAITGINNRLDNLDLTYATDEDIQNLQTQINTKANQSALDGTNANVTSNTNAISNINTRLDNLDLTYATDEDVQNLQSQINTKANQSALDSTNSQVSTNTSNISSLNTTKANQSDLNSTNSRVSTLESTVTQLSPQVAKSLKTPMSAPSSTELVAIDTSNGQAMISIGAGLVIENDTLKSTGGVQIVDNLTSTSISAALSANQGRILNSTISSVSSIADNNTEQIEFLQSDMASKTNVTIANVHQDSINFTSNPQTQLDSKASQSALNSTNANVSANTSSISSLNTNKANVDLSNVTYPTFVASGSVRSSSGYTTYMSNGTKIWYIIFPTGLKICHLVIDSLPSTDTPQQVTLPITFNTTTYMVHIQRSYGGSYLRLDDVGITDKTTSGFKTRGYNAPVDITCIGY